MATVAELVEMIAVVTATEEKTVKAYARALIDAGALPKSSGRAIAHVNTSHAAKLLLAVALKPTINATALMVDIYSLLDANTPDGRRTALSVLEDLFDAASAGGLRDDEWQDVAIVVFDDKLGIDVHLPASRGSRKADRVIKFRLPEGVGVGDLDRFKLSPNPYFTRSARITFGGLLFICQLMKARQPEGTAGGTWAIEKLLSLRQIEDDERPTK